MAFPLAAAALLAAGMGAQAGGSILSSRSARKSAEELRGREDVLNSLIQQRQGEVSRYLRPRIKAGGIGYGPSFLSSAVSRFRKQRAPGRAESRNALEVALARRGLRQSGPALHNLANLERDFGREEAIATEGFILEQQRARLEDLYKSLALLSRLSEGRGLGVGSPVPGRGLGYGAALRGVGDQASTLAGLLFAKEFYGGGGGSSG